MSINAITQNVQNSTTVGSSYAQVNPNRAGQRPPPPRGLEGGGGGGGGVGRLLGAIANALQNLGQTQTTTGTTSSTSDTSNTDQLIQGASNESDSSDTNAAGSTNNAAQALGTFLQDLMAALQQSSGRGEFGKGAPPPPADLDAGGGGPLAKDLQNLIRRLSSSTSTGTSAATDSATTSGTGDSTSVTTSNTTSASTDALSQSFSDLLDALGLSSQDNDTSLQNFLQTILSQVNQGGRQGNFINTSA
ncbi:hypothetical protein RF679_03210 [Undibacterium cyanobacteriorum]|uniref:Uncharacterized protein n=1 Tax=Undibacterium cyanobacteriorum TaxID=3073561 RepID=A0ABY9RJ98_9BURK|nr:hypothetical protein [Undibacterium sp. 20NA77.5]WMW81299.1 hypothetical protein RF679_03210 [Undibacterium sp. 20NA77.5]